MIPYNQTPNLTEFGASKHCNQSLSGRAQLCHPHRSRHPCTEKAGKAALTAVTSEFRIMAHSCTLGSQEIPTAFASKCEPEKAQLKEDYKKSRC